LPAALQKVTALGGRGTILEYANRPGRFFYRELVEGQRRYRSVLIKGASTIEEAQLLAIDAYGELREQQSKVTAGNSTSQQQGGVGGSPGKNQQERKRKNPSPNEGLAGSVSEITVAEAVEQFLNAQAEKCAAGMLKEGTLKEKRQVLRTHLVPYLESEGLSTVGEIERMTFERYLLYRRETTKLTKRKELSIIRDFTRNHLVRNGLEKADQVSRSALVDYSGMGFGHRER